MPIILIPFYVNRIENLKKKTEKKCLPSFLGCHEGEREAKVKFFLLTNFE